MAAWEGTYAKNIRAIKGNLKVFLFSSYSTLHLVIKNHLFYNGRLKVRCVARIYDVYHRSFEKSVDLEKKHRHSHKSLYSTTESFMFEFGSNLVEYHALPAERRPDATRELM